jgi:hypothetical protein
MTPPSLSVSIRVVSEVCLIYLVYKHTIFKYIYMCVCVCVCLGACVRAFGLSCKRFWHKFGCSYGQVWAVFCWASSAVGIHSAARTCKSELCSAEPPMQSPCTLCHTIRGVLRRVFQSHSVEYDLALTRVSNNLVLRRNGSCAGSLTMFPVALVNIASVWNCFYSVRSIRNPLKGDIDPNIL